MYSENSLEQEDSLSFTSTVFGALGSALQQQTSPKVLLLGLVLASVAKALPSLGSPAKKKRRLEDWILFLAAVIAALGAGIESNFTFSDSLSQGILVVGLVIALAGKAIPSLVTNRKSLEDWVPFIAAVASAIAILPFGNQYAAAGLFFGYLAKELLSSSSH
jgi:hypothetical protein